MNRRAFSLVELIIAIFILGIGMISIAALFPAGIKQQEIAEDDVYGPLVAKHAMELLRTRLKQEDFGSFEDFSSDTNTVRDPVPLQSSTNIGMNAIASTIAKDWIWKRPGFITVDDPSSTGCDEAGMYDIFSYYSTRKNVGGDRSGTNPPIPAEFTPTTLLSDVAITTTGRNRLYGIPYNRRIYDEQFDVTQPNYAWTYSQNTIPASGSLPTVSPGNALREPAVFITQRERYWPMPSNAVGATPTPKYVWDCMFRRFNGRILVGMFVYRVLPANGLRGGNYADNNGQTMGTPYVGAQVTQEIDKKDPLIPSTIKDFPPIPQWVSSRDPMKNLSVNMWGAGGLDGKVGYTIDASQFSPNRDDCGVPGTSPSTNETALTYSELWQQPGQWMIDQYNNVHHVIEGRRTHADGPVILAKPVPRQPYSNALFDSANRILSSSPESTALLATAASGGDAPKGIQDLWFIPSYDANGNQLLPVFACVEEL
jgi:prepilin-type N-terminal cleavage/methylation domain-containing protein